MSGSSIRPLYYFTSDESLGWFRSGTSAMALSYGQLLHPGGSALQPSMGFSSESSLGFFASGASAIGLSYGQIQLPAGTALQPSLAFSSESSLGWYRSTTSTMAPSYGTVDFTSAQASFATLVVRTGTAINPSIGFSSETSLGFYRSAASNLDLSYGTLVIPNSGTVVFRDSGAALGFRVGCIPGSNAAQLLQANTSTIDVKISSTTRMRFDSQGSITIFQNRLVSVRTLAASSVTPSAAKTNVAVDEMVFTIGGASGASLVISSGGTAYIFHSTTSAILA